SLWATCPFTRIVSGIITGLAGLPEDLSVFVSPADCAEALLLPTMISERNAAKMPATGLCVRTSLISAPINLGQLTRIIQASLRERLQSGRVSLIGLKRIASTY